MHGVCAPSNGESLSCIMSAAEAVEGSKARGLESVLPMEAGYSYTGSISS